MRWTNGHAEIKHLVSIQNELTNAIGNGFLIKITLLDGRIFEGFLSNQSSGNNGISFSSFYANLTLLTLDNNKFEIDLLDIKNIVNSTTKDKVKEYEEAGIITIVDYSNS
jgi:hypothetical protein